MIVEFRLDCQIDALACKGDSIIAFSIMPRRIENCCFKAQVENIFSHPPPSKSLQPCTPDWCECQILSLQACKGEFCTMLRKCYVDVTADATTKVTAALFFVITSKKRSSSNGNKHKLIVNYIFGCKILQPRPTKMLLAEGRRRFQAQPAAVLRDSFVS